MKTYQVKLNSVSPLSMSRFHNIPLDDRELHEAHERRTWRNRLHAMADGEVYIPPMMIKNCLSEAAKFLGEKVAGKGRNQYTKHFLAGTLVTDPIMLGVKVGDVPGEWLWMSPTGKKGPGPRVQRCYPRIDTWSGVAIIHILDEIITQDVLARTLTAAGSFIGLGRFRPQVGGFYGRFSVESISEVK